MPLLTRHSRVNSENSLGLARQRGVKTIVFPSISTGVYGYPKDRAARIAVAVLREYEPDFVDMICCCFSEEDRMLYETLLAEEAGGP